MHRTVRSRTLVPRVLTAFALTALLFGGGNIPGAVGHTFSSSLGVAQATSACSLGPNGAIQHVIYFQFDNVHFTRDIPNVPSDLEQMPHLKSFIENNGVMVTHNHTPLISHTSEDILTSLTGLYPAHHGVAVGQNSYEYYNSQQHPTSFSTAFTYWTDTIGNGTYNMLSGPPTAQKPTGTNTPAPWVPYVKAGCDVGGVASANQELENANVNSVNGANDIGTVFGVNSPEAQESTAARTRDFVGIAIHCSQADSGANGMCASTNNGKPDLLPDEPGGYSNFNALYGNKYVQPVISPGGPVQDINGNTVVDSTSTPGFPGFDGMSAAVSLGYVADMQEHGVPVTYAYISDAHDLAGAPSHTALGPGEQGYEQQLQAYDQAWAAFFTRLQNDGITPANTLFVFTADENDHYTGGLPNNPGCTGATINNATNPPTVTPGNYCTYTKTPLTFPGPPFGEIAVGLGGLLSHEANLTSYTFTVGNDTAPGVYLDGNPTRATPSVRTFERAAGTLTVTNPLTNSVERLAEYMADPVEENILHMITYDPARTPTFTLFAQSGLYVTGTCTGGFNVFPNPTYSQNCVLEEPAFAWLHGNIQPDISTTWLGMAGPGILHYGDDTQTWSDHTDIRPTMMADLGLHDDYTHDGRVLYEDLAPSVTPPAVQSEEALVLQVAQLYKQLDAAVGEFALATVQVSTNALISGSSGNDTKYSVLENRLLSLGRQRDALVAQMNAALERAEFSDIPMNPAQGHHFISLGTSLIRQAQIVARASS